MKLTGWLREPKGLQISYRTLVRYLHEHDYARRIPRAIQGYYGGHVRRNVVVSVEPATRRLVSLIVAHCNTEVFLAFLDTMAKGIPPQRGKQLHFALDNAGWQTRAALNWHHIRRGSSPSEPAPRLPPAVVR